MQKPLRRSRVGAKVVLVNQRSYWILGPGTWRRIVPLAGGFFFEADTRTSLNSSTINHHFGSA